MREQEMIELIKAKNEKGAEELLRTYSPLIRYIIAPILQNLHDQEECIAEVSLRVWENIHSFADCAWLPRKYFRRFVGGRIFYSNRNVR